MEKPKLTTPMVLSLFAGLFFFIAYRINPQSSTQEGIRLFFQLLGVLLALWAFVTGGDWLISRLMVYLKESKEAWNAPKLEMARYVSSMSRDQIRLYEQIGTFESISYLGNKGMRHTLYTPEQNIPFTWIIDYLEKCEPIYPRLLPQHGMPDTLQRDFVRFFTAHMIKNNMAEKSLGTRPARWIVPIEEVYKRLEIVDA